MPTEIDIRSSILAQIEAAQDDIVRLRKALEAFDGVAMPAQRPERQPAPRRRRVKVERKAVVPAGKIMAALADGADGVTTSTLAKQLDGDQAQVLQLLKEAEVEGTVRRSGARRATRWHLITDEDRIAARVKELEAAGTGH